MTIWGSVFQVSQGALHIDISQHHELIHHDTAEEYGNDHDGDLSHPKMAVETQDERSASNQGKLDCPGNVAVRINGPSDDRIKLHATTRQNDYRK